MLLIVLVLFDVSYIKMVFRQSIQPHRSVGRNGRGILGLPNKECQYGQARYFGAVVFPKNLQQWAAARLVDRIEPYWGDVWKVQYRKETGEDQETHKPENSMLSRWE